MKVLKKMVSSIKYDFEFLKVLNSPLVGLKLKWYLGEIKHGTPYFLPRRWVKCTSGDANKAWGKLSIETHRAITKTISKDQWLKDYAKTHTKAIPIKYFGWHFTTLGWKTKWDDYRFEWSPSLSIVIFGKQLFINIIPKIIKHDDTKWGVDCYWEAWLNYNYKTDKTKSKKKRLEELKKIYSCTWSDGKGNSTNYYDYILKPNK